MKLKGLYYPYSLCRDSTAIKRSLLVFDEIYFIDPVERLVREYLTDKENYPEAKTLSHTFSQLEEAGIAKRIDPFGRIRECDKLLWEAAATDEKDEKLQSLLQEELLQDTLGILKNEYQGSGGIHLAAETKEAMASTTDGMSKEQAKETEVYGTIRDLSSEYIKKIAHKYVHPAFGLALGINHTLVVAEDTDYVPFTDSDIAHRCLLHKYRKAEEGKQKSTSQKIKSSQIDDQKLIALSMNVFDSFMSDEDLSQRSISDIVNFRSNNKEDFTKFCTRIRELITEIESKRWDDSFRNGILKKIHKEIEHEIKDAEDKLASAYDKMFGGIEKKDSTLSTPTLIGTVLAGLSPAEILAYSTTVITGALGIAIPEFLDLWLAKKKVRRNSFSLLITAHR